MSCFGLDRRHCGRRERPGNHGTARDCPGLYKRLRASRIAFATVIHRNSPVFFPTLQDPSEGPT
jgi:hypothetical protein